MHLENGGGLITEPSCFFSTNVKSAHPSAIVPNMKIQFYLVSIKITRGNPLNKLPLVTECMFHPWTRCVVKIYLLRAVLVGKAPGPPTMLVFVNVDNLVQHKN